jgi:hypothetical protein
MLTRGARQYGPGALAQGDFHRRELVFVLFDDDRFKVFGFKNLAAIETFEVVYTIATGDDLGTDVVTGGLHKQRFIETYSNRV